MKTISDSTNPHDDWIKAVFRQLTVILRKLLFSSNIDAFSSAPLSTLSCQQPHRRHVLNKRKTLLANPLSKYNFICWISHLRPSKYNYDEVKALTSFDLFVFVFVF